jgi:sulfide dehydrogenase cytochrome subunit
MRKVLILSLGLLATSAFAAPPPKAVGCGDCHGDNGASTDPKVPGIGGMSALYLEEELLAYRDEARPCHESTYNRGADKGKKTDMCKAMQGFSDAEITAVAEFFAAQKWVPAKQASDPARAAVGAKVHAKACEKCHSEGGSLADDDASILAGQHRAYLELTFKEYRAKQRAMDKKMAPRIAELTDAEVAALVEFYAAGGK